MSVYANTLAPDEITLGFVEEYMKDIGFGSKLNPRDKILARHAHKIVSREWNKRNAKLALLRAKAGEN